MTTGVLTDMSQRRETFFRLIFGPTRGYICIGVLEREKRLMKESFYYYPNDLSEMLASIEKVQPGRNIYFCPQILSAQKRDKEHVTLCPSAWSDLDLCPPENLLVKPSVVLETSPGRYQALWVFDKAIEPSEAENVSRRIAYHHAPEGADRSGWDLSQLLRVPLTFNYNHGTESDTPQVKVIEANKSKFRLSDFDCYEQVVGQEFLDIPFPEHLPEETADDILQRFRLKLNPLVWRLYQQAPEKDWSKALWQLEMLLLEGGLTKEEVLVVARESACNKYHRDGRTDATLWRDVCRASAKFEENSDIAVSANYQETPLLSDDEREDVKRQASFIERYSDWATGLGDAAAQYHQAGAFISLATVLSGAVRLPTSFGTIIPNLWFMILADTTLTRKSTAMDLAVDLLMEIDSDMILATDGSIEGLLTSLSTRPGKPSVFLRDEFSGLLEMITKKEYLAGMPEMLTKLYDGKFQKRILRKEIIEVRDPVLLLFAGGIRSRILSILTYEHVASGFMPRFIYITAESDVAGLQPLGPPTKVDLGKRAEIKNELDEMYSFYNQTVSLKLKGTSISTTNKQWNASLTEGAWSRYNKLEKLMLQGGMEANRPDIMTPTYDRLSKSTLKAAVLLAASRQREESVTVEERDICQAISYCESWREYAKEVINGVGIGNAEKQLNLVLGAIEKRPGGMPRSQLMQTYHLNARDTEQIIITLEQRGLILRQRVGRTEILSSAKRKVVR